MNPKVRLSVLVSSLVVVAAAAYAKPVDAANVSSEKTINQRLERVRQTISETENQNIPNQKVSESNQLMARWGNYWSNGCWWVNFYNYGTWVSRVYC
ncbi:MAG: rSAM-associated Gly-rich repeat protein [Richelia sp. RM1_1_1]|nr:rSAM-associated Gly-rich repeat protein [Calothrix sp. SM1_7_51]NJN08157.1 rSAM-associated Gly-rich repeat protein [Richelia sp. RM1_1_1]